MWTTVKRSVFVIPLILMMCGSSSLAGENSVGSKILEATHIIDAVILGHWEDGGTKIDVRDLFKGEFVPKHLRGIVHEESKSGKMGESAQTFLKQGNRYVIFVFDNYFVEPSTVFVVHEKDGQLICECPEGSGNRPMLIDEFRHLVESSLLKYGRD